MQQVNQASVIQASPALRRMASRTPEENLEAHRRVMARPLIEAAINAQSGLEPVGVVSARIVGKLRANLKREMS